MVSALHHQGKSSAAKICVFFWSLWRGKAGSCCCWSDPLFQILPAYPQQALFGCKLCGQRQDRPFVASSFNRPRPCFAQASEGTPTFIDACQAPLLRMLGPGDLKRLQHTCKHLRHIVHNQAESLMIGAALQPLHATEMLLFQKGIWHNLHTLVLLGPISYQALWTLTTVTLPHLINLKLNVQLYTSAFNRLAQGHWPQLASLDLEGSRPSAFAMASLKHGQWPCLKHLILKDCDLTAAGISYLTDPRWSKLKMLDISDNDLDAACISNLGSAAWPDLQNLQVGDLQGDATWGHLLNGSWTALRQLNVRIEAGDAAGVMPPSINDCFPDLHHLGIFSSNITSALAASVTANWQSRLQTLKLMGSNLSGSALEPIRRGTWAALQRLNLDLAHLDAGSMACLVQANMPALQYLSLFKVQGMDVAAFAELALGFWPFLAFLTLSGVHISADCMAELAKGEWHALFWLDLSSCGITHAALRYLVKGKWSSLQSLDLSCNGLNSRSYDLLRGKSKQRLSLGVNHLRPCKRFAAGHWPELDAIDLSAS